MTGRRLIGRVAIALLGSVVVILAGCKTNEGRQAKVARAAVTSLDETRQELVKADQEVSQALTAMDQLAAQPRDLKQAYRTFGTEVTDASKQSQEARERADRMQAQWQDYIATWEQQAESIASAELRAGATERRQTVRENYDHLRDAANATQAAYEPFLRQLRDIQRALSLDLTPAGVEAAKPAMETARQTGNQLKEQIDAFIEELDTVSAKRAALPSAPAPVAGEEP
jgi:chromosome segregation ATPase